MFKKIHLSFCAAFFLFMSAITMQSCTEEKIVNVEVEVEKEIEVPVYVDGKTILIPKEAAGRFAPQTLGFTLGARISELGFAWYSEDGARSFLAIRRESEDSSRIFKGSRGVAPNGSHWHKANVRGLNANTAYSYSVSVDSINWSDWHAYKTPAGVGGFTFAVTADPQLTDVTTNTEGNQDLESNWFSSDGSTAEGWKYTMEKIAEKNVNFVINCGDQVDAYPGSEEEYTHFFAPPALRNIPLVPSIGNHDNHNLSPLHFNLPSTNTNGNFYYRYHNVLFVVLNTAPYPETRSRATRLVDQFKITIETAKRVNPGYKWLIVHHHKSTQSLGDHICDQDLMWYEQGGFDKLMTDQKVDLVLSGHDHIYSRTYLVQIDSVGGPGKIVSEEMDNIITSDGGGTVYMGFNTASGLKYYPAFYYGLGGNREDYPFLKNGTRGKTAYLDDSQPEEDRWPWSLAKYSQSKTPEFTIFEVDGDRITIKAYSVTSPNTPFDEFTITKSGMAL
jgi:hypothetical protein